MTEYLAENSRLRQLSRRYSEGQASLEEFRAARRDILVALEAVLLNASFTPDLVQMMFGKVVQPDQRINACQEEPALELDKLSIEDYRLQIRDVSLKVCRGEVIGLAGMEGSGQRHFLRTLGGLTRPVGGRLALEGKDLTGKVVLCSGGIGPFFGPAAERGAVGILSYTALRPNEYADQIPQTRFVPPAGATNPTFGWALEPNEILVVANTNNAASVRLARYYCERRGIPANRVIPVSLGTPLRFSALPTAKTER